MKQTCLINVKKYKNPTLPSLCGEGSGERFRLFFFWIAGCLILLSRRPSTLFFSQFWAEDGFVFFHEALKYGWRSVVIPSAGYIHLVPRTITNLALQLSEALGRGIVYAPLFMNLSVIAISSICAVTVCSSKFKYLGNLYFRIALSLFILLFPNAYEVFGNTTNVNWWLSILEFFLLWNLVLSRKIPGWFETILLSIIVLTTPNGLLVLPTIILCYYFINKYKPTYDLFKVFLIFLLTGIQVALMLNSRAPEETDWMLFIAGTANYVFVQIFGHLLMEGIIFNKFVIIIVGVIFTVVFLFLCRSVSKKIYFPVVFLFLLVFLTIFGAMGQRSSGRYIFVPSVVVVSTLMYAFQEQLHKEKNKCKMLKTGLLYLIFLLISVRVVCNYPILPLVNYPWKTEAAVFDRQGCVFYNIPINPNYWSVGFPSSFDRNTDTSRFRKKFTIDNSCIVSVNDLVVKDSLYTVTGLRPSVCYQLPEMPVSCCWIDFDHSIEALQMVFISETGEDFSMLFHVEENNWMNMNESIQATRMKSVQFYFYNPMRNGFYTLPASSFVIKQFHFYALPNNKK
jgi:hypothetical protein